jgi:hypothetical protein
MREACGRLVEETERLPAAVDGASLEKAGGSDRTPDAPRR